MSARGADEPSVAAGRVRRRRMSGADRLLVAVLVVDACVLALGLLNQVPGLYKQILDLEGEHNLPTWVSSLQLAGVAIAAAVCSGLLAGRMRLAFGAFAVIFAFLSLDELALIHELVIQNIEGSARADPWYWPVFYLPLGVVLLVATAGVVLEVRRTLGSPALPLAGLGMLVASVVLDAAATRLRGTGLLFGVVVFVEEVFELVGSALLVYALFRLIASRVRVERIPERAPDAVADRPR